MRTKFDMSDSLGQVQIPKLFWNNNKMLIAFSTAKYQSFHISNGNPLFLILDLFLKGNDVLFAFATDM